MSNGKGGHGAGSLPASVDLRLATFTDAVLVNQPTAQCVPCSLAGAISSTWNKQRGSVGPNASARFIAYASGNQNLLTAAHSVKAGIVTVDLWDWQRNPDGSFVVDAGGFPLGRFDTPPQSVLDEAKHHTCTVVGVRRQLSGLKETLEQGFAVAFDGSGSWAGHERCVVGYDEALRTFLIADTIGPSFYTVGYDEFLSRSQECFAVTRVG